MREKNLVDRILWPTRERSRVRFRTSSSLIQEVKSTALTILNATGVFLYPAFLIVIM